MSDNFHFDMTGVSLDKALAVAFSNHPHCVGFTSTPERLTFFWTEPPPSSRVNFSALPKMSGEGIKPIIEAWQNDVAAYGNEPRHDGDNGRGLRIFNEAWGHVGGDWTAFMGIEPAWLMYGK